MTGSSSKWHLKNQRSGFTSSSATSSPLSCAPPLSVILVIRSNIKSGGKGSRALPGPNSLPWAQANSSS